MPAWCHRARDTVVLATRAMALRAMRLRARGSRCAGNRLRRVRLRACREVPRSSPLAGRFHRSRGDQLRERRHDVAGVGAKRAVDLFDALPGMSIDVIAEVRRECFNLGWRSLGAERAMRTSRSRSSRRDGARISHRRAQRNEGRLSGHGRDLSDEGVNRFFELSVCCRHRRQCSPRRVVAPVRTGHV